ncbi:MAG: archaemetzincin family Zn-dependent metalloprotease [Thermoproteota archaeon]|nr:archaemetzincin family Zn-dependent metalloprotease [Thermoproteota archaeon]
MEVAVLPVGCVDFNVLQGVRRGLRKGFPGVRCVVVEKVMSLPENGYDRARRQYCSTILLRMIRQFAEGIEVDRVLGVADVDLYAYGLNFVFGEAENPGKTAIISLYRLRPTFYGQPPNKMLLVQRAVKEAVHEVGHTFGLKHCDNRSCVMFFSNSIGMVDTKNSKFCRRCSRALNISIRIQIDSCSGSSSNANNA